MSEAALAARLSRLSPEQRARLRRTVRTTIEHRDRESIPVLDRSSGRLPMSSAQRRLYFLQNLEPESTAYNLVEALRLSGPLDVPAVHAALATVVARHEVLRTKCVSDTELLLADEATVKAELGLGFLDLSTEGARAPLVNVRRLFARLAARPFQLDSEFPLRVTLVRLAEHDHALLFVAHHIASDAWSSRALLREFLAAYAGADLAPLPVQYADYAAWRGDAEEHLDYWRERLAGMPPMLELPLDHPRPPTRSDKGAELHLDLDPELCGRLWEVARRESVTPFVLLLTAFGQVLHRHCGTEDVVVGSPVAGRDHPDVENLLGCFINTLVLRLDLSEAASVRDLLRRVHESTLDDYEHRDLPFERLLAELNPDRDLSTNQLVQVMFNYHAATVLGADLPGLAVRPMEIGYARARFDLSCNVVETGGALRVTLTYAAELFSRTTITRLGAHFVETLEVLLDDLDAPAAALPAIPAVDWPLLRHAEAARPGTPLLTRFEHHAAADPRFPAVRCRDEVLDYGQLNGRANQLARHLLATGTKPGDRVALLFERSVDYVVAMLAVQKAGATYVPLDPATPASHIVSVLAAASTTILLTHNEVDRTEVTALAPPAVDILVLEDLPLAEQSTVDIGRRPVDTEAMYVVFTSGSTGRPKGVVVEHRNFTNYLTGILDRLEVPDKLSFALVSTLAADLGLTNLYGALATGGTVHVLPYEWAVDPERLAGYFRRHRIDFLKLVPSHLRAINDAGLLPAVVPKRILVLAGEACPWDLVETVRAIRPECAIWNNYGPSETTVAVLAHRVAGERSAGTSVPLGSPIANVAVHVVDEHLRPVPLGTPGELLITGASVARGYLSTEDDTRFVADPYSADPAARAYRSGDRGRLLPSGVFEFLGRLDRPGPATGGEMTAPRHALDERIAAAWREVLGLNEVGIDDDFFAIGGDSFAAMRLARRIGDGLRVASVFQYPTVRGLSDLLGVGMGPGGVLVRLSGQARAAVATVAAVPFGGGTAAAPCGTAGG
jgi:amino acid adenylation domain-containing protein